MDKFVRYLLLTVGYSSLCALLIGFGIFLLDNIGVELLILLALDFLIFCMIYAAVDFGERYLNERDDGR